MIDLIEISEIEEIPGLIKASIGSCLFLKRLTSFGHQILIVDVPLSIINNVATLQLFIMRFDHGIAYSNLYGLDGRTVANTANKPDDVLRFMREKNPDCEQWLLNNPEYLIYPGWL